MVLYEVFYQAEIRKYKAHIFSKATVFSVIVFAISIIAPFLVVYRSYGFWIKHDSFITMPSAAFKYQYILVVGTSSGTNYIATSYTNLNTLLQSRITGTIISANDFDVDQDGVNDYMTFSAEIPLSDTDQIVSANVLLVYSYNLMIYGTFTMESLGYISYSALVPGCELTVFGDLQLVQYAPLNYKGNDVAYNFSVVNSTSISASAFNFDNILQQYSKRNVTTKIDNQYVIWKPIRPLGQPFKINVKVNYRKAYVIYTPGFFFIMKWAWVQYVSVLLIFLFVFDRIKTFVFQNQIISTFVQRPQLACCTHGKKL